MKPFAPNLDPGPLRRGLCALGAALLACNPAAIHGTTPGGSGGAAPAGSGAGGAGPGTGVSLPDAGVSTSDARSDGPPGPPATCAHEIQGAKSVPVDLLLLVDTSQSMRDWAGMRASGRWCTP